MENVLSVLFCLSLFYLAVTARVQAYITILAGQGILLTALLVLPLVHRLSPFALILPVTIFLVKVILVPRYMRRIVKDLEINPVIEPTIQPFSFLLLVIFSVVVIFVVSGLLSATTPIETIPFASGFSAIVIGIYVVIFRVKLIVHVAGFLIMENGIFLFGTAVASEFPMIVEIGMLLDIFVVVFLMGIVLTRIRLTTGEIDVKAIRGLKQ